MARQNQNTEKQLTYKMREDDQNYNILWSMYR